MKRTVFKVNEFEFVSLFILGITNRTLIVFITARLIKELYKIISSEAGMERNRLSSYKSLETRFIYPGRLETRFIYPGRLETRFIYPGRLETRSIYPGRLETRFIYPGRLDSKIKESFKNLPC